VRSIVSFLVLFATWLTLSGQPSPFLVASGALCSAGIVALMIRLELLGSGPWPLRLGRLLFSYLPWLAWQVLKANLDVARRVWSPRLDIEPRLIRIKNGPRTAAGTALHANSITLTPGTVTVAVSEQELLVHALTETAAADLERGAMRDRIQALERSS
jgi:multicomponent Na+:H+ antiporter subunit E